MKGTAKMYDNLGIDLSRVYGFGFDDYDTARLPELSEEDKKKWYSKFYYAGRPELPESLTKLFAKGNMMDPKDAVLPGSYDLLTQEGENDDDLGYCLLENGVGYGSTHNAMNGVNMEMFEWYKKLRMVDQLSYMIWYPGSHFSELKGITIEDVGFGTNDFHMVSRLDPEMLGFTVHPAEKDPRFMCILGANAVIKNRDYPEIRPLAISLFHYVRALDDGSLDFRTHFFTGGMIIDGELIRMQKLDPDVCLEITRQMCSHCCYERCNVETFLPELYARKDEFDLSAAEKMQSDMMIIK